MWRSGGCSNALEDPWDEPNESMFTRSVSPEAAPDKPTYIEIEYEQGDPVAIDGIRLSPASLLTNLNKVAGENGALLHTPCTTGCTAASAPSGSCCACGKLMQRDCLLLMASSFCFSHIAVDGKPHLNYCQQGLLALLLFDHGPCPAFQ